MILDKFRDEAVGIGEGVGGKRQVGVAIEFVVEGRALELRVLVGGPSHAMPPLVVSEHGGGL